MFNLMDNNDICYCWMHLLVAYCTTSLQTPSSAIFKLHSSAQSFGCGCAKAIFPTTTIEKQASTQISKLTF
jgi:hypothetical protein